MKVSFGFPSFFDLRKRFVKGSFWFPVERGDFNRALGGEWAVVSFHFVCWKYLGRKVRVKVMNVRV